MLQTWLTALCWCVTVSVRVVLTAVGISPFHVSTYMSAVRTTATEDMLLIDMPLQLKLASASCMWPAVAHNHLVHKTWAEYVAGCEAPVYNSSIGG